MEADATGVKVLQSNRLVAWLDIDAFSRGRIDASVAELGEERDAVSELGLI